MYKAEDFGIPVDTNEQKESLRKKILSYPPHPNREKALEYLGRESLTLFEAGQLARYMISFQNAQAYLGGSRGKEVMDELDARDAVHRKISELEKLLK